MANVRSSRPVQRGRASAKRRDAWSPLYVILWGGLVVIVLLGGLAMYQAASRRTTASPAAESLARANAGGDVAAHTGTNHTVYESLAALPSPSTPRADGKPTLVWFSATTCEYCQQMGAFAHETAHSFTDRLAFVEKRIDVGGAADAGRFHIQGTPTFVLIDARGKEVARFYFQRSSQEFANAIGAALQKAGA